MLKRKKEFASKVPEGSEVKVGQLIAILVEKGTNWKSAVVPTATKVAASATPAAAVPTPKTGAPSAPSPCGPKPPASGQVYGLSVKRLLEEYGLSSGSIKGTGRTNRLLKSDVLTYIQSNNLQRVAPQTGEIK
ncbi:dihydrolipoyllysine-residue acetyltransferase component of pyruvate dehydrogenase complex-like [Belonocnema kinseyi]|uniref:dihydrolipoyllysine-residue acetyltransferase component of pyruvate dehydrogenase complex-like n=1 Tax=Belonocnema kinseyi TaxID=2817044 RepID=UPI00143D93AF|nr:dihydrolipoyllysine-residue acetyltransferase component of pyruvate dehydrogenase complex-like [Belonocnema kinseyi]